MCLGKILQLLVYHPRIIPCTRRRFPTCLYQQLLKKIPFMHCDKTDWVGDPFKRYRRHCPLRYIPFSCRG